MDIHMSLVKESINPYLNPRMIFFFKLWLSFFRNLLGMSVSLEPQEMQFSWWFAVMMLCYYVLQIGMCFACY